MSIELKDEKLSNGVRVVTEQNPAALSISLGLWMNVGSRDEGVEEWGCSHFLEHLLFKGTERRTAHEISSAIENRGGYLNAFTDRDMTAYYSRILSRDQDIATDLLCDIVENSLLRKDDTEMERQVILEEIKQINDDPSSLIHELYINNIWRGSPSAHPIIGTMETISNMQLENIVEYYERNYNNHFIAVASGAIDHDKFVSDIENFIEKGRGIYQKNRLRPDHYAGYKFIERESSQVQLAISSPGFPYGEDETATQSVISSYLGLGASSRLFQEVREKMGLVYNIYTYNQNLEDVGAFSILAGTSEHNLKKVIEVILRELENIKQGLDIETLKTVKHKAVGLFILNAENNRHRMHHLGVSTLRDGKPRTIEDVIGKFEAVTNEDIQCVADWMFNRDKIAITALGISETEVEDLESLIN